MKSLPSRLAPTLIAVAFCAVLYTVAPTANAGVLAFGSHASAGRGLGVTSSDTVIGK